MAVASARRVERPRARALSLWLLARVENASGGGLGQGLAHRHGPRTAAAAYEALWRVLRNVLREGRRGCAFADEPTSGLLRKNGTVEPSCLELSAWLQPQLPAAPQALAELEDELSETFGDVGPLGSFDAACESAELRNRVFPTLARLASVRDDAELRVFARRFGLPALDEYLSEPGRSRLLIDLYAQLLEGIWRRAGIEVDVRWPALALARRDVPEQLWTFALGSEAAFGELLDSLLRASSHSALRPPSNGLTLARSSHRAPRPPGDERTALPRSISGSPESWLHAPASNDLSEPVSGIVPLLRQPTAGPAEPTAQSATATPAVTATSALDTAAAPGAAEPATKLDGQVGPGIRPQVTVAARRTSAAYPVVPSAKRGNSWLRALLIGAFLGLCVLLALLGQHVAPNAGWRSALGAAPAQKAAQLAPPHSTNATSTLAAATGNEGAAAAMLAAGRSQDVSAPLTVATTGAELVNATWLSPLSAAGPEGSVPAPLLSPLRAAAAQDPALLSPLREDPSLLSTLTAAPMRAAQTPLLAAPAAREGAEGAPAPVPVPLSAAMDSWVVTVPFAAQPNDVTSSAATTPAKVVQASARPRRDHSAQNPKTAASATASDPAEPLPYVIDFSPIPADVTLSIGDQKITGFGTLLVEELPETVQLVAQREGYETRRIKISRDTFTEQNGVRWRRIYVTLRSNEEVASVLNPTRR